MELTQAELGLLVAGIALAGVILGGLVAGCFAILTGWLDNRREHRRWLRERRYGVYIETSSLLNKIRDISVVPVNLATPKDAVAAKAALKRLKRLRKLLKEVGPELVDVSSRLYLLGPRKLSVSFTRCATELLTLATDKESPGDPLEKFLKLRAQYFRDIQDELRAGWPWQRVTQDDASVFKEIQKERSGETAPREAPTPT
jgi:hypothetical protein